MSIFNLAIHPDDRLRQVSRAITEDELREGVADGINLRDFIGSMHETRRASRGIGLAAPQVGIGLRIWVSDADFHVINPVISNMMGEMVSREGCLSIPRERFDVRRATSLVLRGRNLAGERIEQALTGIKAIVAQHETDHLDGVLIVD